MGDVTHLEPLPSRYVTRAELALLLGVSDDTVDRMRKAGMPSVVFGVRCRRFPLLAAETWARKHGRMAA